jgi:hypothetical protein
VLTAGPISARSERAVSFNRFRSGGFKTKPLVAERAHNLNVYNILPVTTFRTIDLEGKKISGPLFSIFCGKQRVFLTANPGRGVFNIRWGQRVAHVFL